MDDQAVETKITPQEIICHPMINGQVVEKASELFKGTYEFDGVTVTNSRQLPVFIFVVRLSNGRAIRVNIGPTAAPNRHERRKAKKLGKH
jgi:hypothetical protein